MHYFLSRQDEALKFLREFSEKPAGKLTSRELNKLYKSLEIMRTEHRRNFFGLAVVVGYYYARCVARDKSWQATVLPQDLGQRVSAAYAWIPFLPHNLVEAAIARDRLGNLQAWYGFKIEENN